MYLRLSYSYKIRELSNVVLSLICIKFHLEFHQLLDLELRENFPRYQWLSTLFIHLIVHY